MHSNLRVHFAQEMHMVRHHFHFHDGRLKLGGGLLNDLFQALINTINQYFAAVFRTPGHMAAAFVLALRQLISTLVLYYTASRYMVQALRTEKHPSPFSLFSTAQGWGENICLISPPL